MSIEGKGKYLGKRKVELDQELNLPPNTDIFFTIEEVKLVEKVEEHKEKKKKENPWLEIAKIARPVGRSDLSVKYHEVLGDVIE